MLKGKRDLVMSRLGDISGVRIPRPEGGFFVFVDARGSQRCAESSYAVDELCRNLLTQCGVLVVPGTSFGCDYGFRLSLCGNEEQLRIGFDRIREFLI
ncbi:MAG: Aspartate aminotransferase (EC [uncultured Caballeronia sp.]|nr:MAG: Aspartate aminotransferase (EC [uncultured Caballeronia sp.]